MVRHDDNGIDEKRMLLPHISKGAAQQTDVAGELIARPAFVETRKQ